jgi:UDP-3-O-[3-hydroxymyristoyl] glucosamine N-acyltransferase
VGVSQHVSIGDRAIIGPQSGVAKSVAEDHVVSGSPAMPHRLWLKVVNLIPKLPEMRKKVGQLEKRLERLEKVSED